MVKKAFAWAKPPQSIIEENGKFEYLIQKGNNNECGKNARKKQLFKNNGSIIFDF